MAKKRSKAVQTSSFPFYYEVRESEAGTVRFSSLSQGEAQHYADLLFKTEGIGFVVDEVDRRGRVQP